MTHDNYFNKLISDLQKDKVNCLQYLINTLSPYILCDHFISNEIHSPRIKVGIRKQKSFLKQISQKNDLLKTKDFNRIKNFDIILCQVNFLTYFYEQVIPLLGIKKVVLITCQTALPQINRNTMTDQILNSEKIILWISQNPIYDNTDKYYAFPYGLKYISVDKYTNVLLKSKKIKKKKKIHHSYLGLNHPCRQKLPQVQQCNHKNFYRQISSSKYMISPIGDRDDCFRHYESIGLGTIPISNVHPYYKNIFEDNMVITDIDSMVKILKDNKISHKYRIPNRDLISFKYHKDKIIKLINKKKCLNSKNQ